MKNNKLGFTLIEVMIVVAIVIILVTVAIPTLLRLRVTANEMAALASLRAINNGCQLYHINNLTYPSSLSDLVSPTSNPPYIDSTLATGEKQGYEFLYQLIDNSHFTVNANPLYTGLLKGKYFYMDEAGIVHVNPASQAGPDDPIY